MPKVHFENLGNINNGTVELKDFTIFCGDNNTGKTYAIYAIYSLLDKNFKYKSKELDTIIDKLYDDGLYELDLKEFFDLNYKKMKNEIEKNFSNNLHSIFSANESEFKKSKIKIDIDEDVIKENLINAYGQNSLKIGKKDTAVFEIIKEKNSYLLKLILLDENIPKNTAINYLKEFLSFFIFYYFTSNSFLLPAERTGLNLFYKELNSKRTAMLHHFNNNDINVNDLVKDLIVSKYPEPIADYIDFLNNLENLKKLNSEYKDLALEIQKEIIKGKYRVEKDGIYFVPYKKGCNKDNYNEKISLHLASSTVKTFFSLIFFLEHLAQKGDTLIIDEPELNLHPNNQRKIARILAMIANRGIRVIVSTHSDYFIREINSLIMLNEDFKSKDEIMQKYSYKENMLLSLGDVNAYLFDKNSVELMEIDSKEGVIAKTFDEVINSLNSSSDEIYYQKEADLEDEQSNN